MSAVTRSEMLAAESAAIRAGWSEEELLDLAGSRLGRAIARFFGANGRAIGFLGKGHNAADAVVALQVLRDEFGWCVAPCPAFPESDWSPLLRRKWRQHGMADEPKAETLVEPHPGPLVILDGLVGTGATGALREPLAGKVGEIEQLRQHHGACVVAVDLPSGVDADTGEARGRFVTADLTCMIANAKAGLLTAHAAHAVGALALVAVDPLRSHGSGHCALISPQMLSHGKSPRRFDLHKGQAGHVALLAGSERYSGAAVLTAIGALHGGAGRVVLHLTAGARQAVVPRLPPEIIVRTCASPLELIASGADAIVVGCGIGTEHSSEVIELIRNTPVPMVVDADALNGVAAAGATAVFDERHVLTPHPGEFRRIAPDLADLPREAAAMAFRDRCAATLLLKGCRSIVAAQDQPLWCNATGNPGMAGDGHGDLLAGVAGALLASGLGTWQSATLAAWLCGRASEIAVWNRGSSPESLTPSTAASMLGEAFTDWKRSRR
jgi:NAD(P)H-hydrate epimerase